jgi:hypothetical protein
MAGSVVASVNRMRWVARRTTQQLLYQMTGWERDEKLCGESVQSKMPGI